MESEEKKIADLWRCATCKFWVKNTKYDWQTSGLCTELKSSDLITIDLKTGWDGGYVDEIETEPTFGCVCWQNTIKAASS